MLFLLLLWSVAWLSKEALSFPNYLDHIPNGHSLRIKNNLILGIGHSNPGGGGSLNSFGKDFFAHEKTWTQQLCELDSDGDGKTNGEELGDPDCVW
jgi:dopamine beta-monooxygenase